MKKAQKSRVSKNETRLAEIDKKRYAFRAKKCLKLEINKRLNGGSFYLV
jgi:hypothetical protein